MAKPKNPQFKTKADYDNWYIKTQKERLNFIMEKGTKDLINQAATKEGITASEFVRRAIEDRLVSTGVIKSSPDQPSSK